MSRMSPSTAGRCRLKQQLLQLLHRVNRMVGRVRERRRRQPAVIAVTVSAPDTGHADRPRAIEVFERVVCHVDGFSRGHAELPEHFRERQHAGLPVGSAKIIRDNDRSEAIPDPERFHFSMLDC